MTSADAVIAVLRAGAEANRTAACRRGSIDEIRAPGRIVATGDLHDNPTHFAKVVELAGLDGGGEGEVERSHLTLHELIHSDRLIQGMDPSYRVLAKAAALKARHPEHVHVLLANHELAQIAGAGITKDGINVVAAFNAAVEYVFGGDAPAVTEAINEFIRSMPLALRAHGQVHHSSGAREGEPGAVMFAHSLPPPELMDRFDPGILWRDLVESDYAPRRGSAHLMVWGRGHTAEQLAELARVWAVDSFVLGHEKAEDGVLLVGERAVVLNTDHAAARVLVMSLDAMPTASAMAAEAARLDQA